MSYGKSFSIKDIVSKIIKISGKKIKISFNKSKPTIKTTISLSNNLVKKNLVGIQKLKLTQVSKKYYLVENHNKRIK